MRTNILGMALRELKRLILNDEKYQTAFNRIISALELTPEECDELQRLYDEEGWAR